MKQLTKAFLIIILSIGQLSSCSYFAPFKVAVLQGNIIEDKADHYIYITVDYRKKILLKLIIIIIYLFDNY